MLATRMRPLIAMLLLGALSLVVLPRELFHECDAHAHATTDGSVLASQCPVCDQALSVYDEVPAATAAPLPVLLRDGVAGAAAQMAVAPLELPGSRGPPLS
jgi:hypothetical protein